MAASSNQSRLGLLFEVERNSQKPSGSSNTRVTVGAWVGIIILVLLVLRAGDTVGAVKVLDVIKGLLNLPW